MYSKICFPFTYFVFTANTTNATIEIWVQGIRINYAWFYHDGTPMEFTCLVSESNHTSETRMRSMSEKNFGCFDITPWGPKMFVCEIYRVFNGFQTFHLGKELMLSAFKKYYYGLCLKKELTNLQLIATWLIVTWVKSGDLLLSVFVRGRRASCFVH